MARPFYGLPDGPAGPNRSTLRHRMSFAPFVRVWIVASALASVAGWVLSLAGCLNRWGYAAFLGLGLILLLLARRDRVITIGCRSWVKARSRFSRPAPFLFGVLAFLVLVGGVLYAPSNYDALTYRLPRVLNWLARGNWHWIHTANYRMNDRTCGFEWLMAPGILFTRSDRALFLINFISFLLLPGLVFSVLLRLGASRRVAWFWMWLLPTGYNFLLQAGSLGNDTFAAVYALAAMDFALRASESRRLSDVWLSLLAAALLTGAKPGNLPLLLPWFLLFYPAAPELFKKPVTSLLVVASAILASLIPTAILNASSCGDWTGLILERQGIAVKHPLIGVLGNSFMFLWGNFVPPLFPAAGWWNQSALSMLPGNLASVVSANFEPGFHQVGEIPTEERAGAGFGLSVLLAVSVGVCVIRRVRSPLGTPSNRTPFRRAWPRQAVLAAPFAALLAFFAKSGMMALSRLVSAYYPLLLPAIVCHPGHAALVRRRGWQRGAQAVMLLAIPVVILTPARPLWPVRSFLSRVDALQVPHPWLKRVKDVYQVYADRPDPLAGVRARLPSDCAVVGFVGTDNETDISLWRPFGRRRVEYILPGDTPEGIRARQITYAVVSGAYLGYNQETIQSWLGRYHAECVAATTATLTVGEGVQSWYVVRFP